MATYALYHWVYKVEGKGIVPCFVMHKQYQEDKISIFPECHERCPYYKQTESEHEANYCELYDSNLYPEYGDSHPCDACKSAVEEWSNADINDLSEDD